VPVRDVISSSSNGAAWLYADAWLYEALAGISVRDVDVAAAVSVSVSPGVCTGWRNDCKLQNKHKVYFLKA